MIVLGLVAKRVGHVATGLARRASQRAPSKGAVPLVDNPLLGDVDVGEIVGPPQQIEQIAR
jgi:hypothetical protein